MNASVKAAIAIGVVALAAFLWFYVQDDGDGDAAGDVTCGLTAAAAGAAVIGLTRGQSASQIAGTAIAGVFVPIVCKAALQTLEEKPDEPVTLCWSFHRAVAKLKPC